MLVSHEHKTIYIHPAKTGGMAVRETLQKHFGFVPVPEYPEGEWHVYNVPEVYRTYKMIGTIRNPYARWLSFYNYVITRETFHPLRVVLKPILDCWGRCSFEAFTRFLLQKESFPYLMPSSVMLPNDTTILRQENLSEEFARLWFTGGFSELPKDVNSFPHPPWRSCYNNETRFLVFDYYRADFDRFGYNSRIVLMRPEIAEIVSYWSDLESPDARYFEVAEQTDWINRFWGDYSKFRQLFFDLDLRKVLDLACGAGRHAEKAARFCDELILLDTSNFALDRCRQRLDDMSHVRYILSDSGESLDGIADETLTAVYSYDSMVHFDWQCVFSYLREIYRTLRYGGRALLHHSLYEGNPGAPFFENLHWRAFMSGTMFLHVAKTVGFSVLIHEALDQCDALTLLEK